MELLRNFRVKLTSPDGQTTIMADGLGDNPGIVANSLVLSRILCAAELNPGECCSASLEVDLYKFTTDVTGYTIVLEDVAAGRSPWFTGIVETCKGASRDMSRHIAAYDMMYYVRNIDIRDWFLNYFETTPEPISIITFRNDLCAHVGLTVDSGVPTLVGDYTEFADDEIWPPDKVTDLNELPFEHALHDLCVLQNCIPTINKRGYITFIPLAACVDAESIGITDNYMHDTTEVSNADLMPFSDIATNINQWWDDHKYTDIGLSVDNIFVLPANPRPYILILREVVAALQNYTYTPADIDLIVSDPNIELGSWVMITDSVCTESLCKITRHHVLRMEFSGPLLVDQHIQSPWPQKK